MITEPTLNLDLNNVDSFLSEMCQKLEIPIMRKLDEFRDRRGKLEDLMQISKLIQQEDTLSALETKINEVNLTIDFLEGLSLSNTNKTNKVSPPQVKEEEHHTPDNPTDSGANCAGNSETEAVGQADSQPSATAEVTEEQAMTEEEPSEPIEANGEEQAVASSESEDADKIAQEALRESRKRGFVSNNPGSRSYNITPANANATSLSY